eukprot:TRINITY_DN5400_c0_g1_i1.p1 TRINITY_DN5400_c0_g1~~TRINITY_DN5400_c0_g1_i1.p1  ORF type:complete len:959 (-),score=173.20 TRINITY_DN5400_c0_g1_i1:44-2920(-)
MISEERVQKLFDEEEEYTNSLKNLVKHSKRLDNAGRVYCEAEESYAQELRKLVLRPCTIKSRTLVESLDKIAQTAQSLASSRKSMIMKSTIGTDISISHLIDFEFAELEHNKTLIDRANYDYQTTLHKVEKDFKKNRVGEDKVHQSEKELNILSSVLNARIKDFEKVVEDFTKRRDGIFLKGLVQNLKTHQEFFKISLELLESIQPDMNEISSYIQPNSKGQTEGQLTICNGRLRRKLWIVIKNGYINFYVTKKEFRPQSSFNLAVCTVRVPSDKNKLEIIKAGKSKPLVFQADSEAERDEWVRIIQHGISDALNAQHLDNFYYSAPNNVDGDDDCALSILRRVPGNFECADCRSKEPEWACINIGILICMECSGVHRSLGTHITKVRSLTLDMLDSELLLFMQSVGNNKGNSLLESNVSLEDEAKRPTEKSDRSMRDHWIVNKYKKKKFLLIPTNTNLSVNQQLFAATMAANQQEKEEGEGEDRVVKVLGLLLMGGEPNWQNPEAGNKTVVHSSVEANNLVLLQLFLEYGGDPTVQDAFGRTSLHYASASDLLLLSCNLLLKRRPSMPHYSSLHDFQGFSPLDLASSENAPLCARLLRGEKITTNLSADKKTIEPSFALTTLKQLIHSPVNEADDFEEDLDAFSPPSPNLLLPVDPNNNFSPNSPGRPPHVVALTLGTDSIPNENPDPVLSLTSSSQIWKAKSLRVTRTALPKPSVESLFLEVPSSASSPSSGSVTPTPGRGEDGQTSDHGQLAGPSSHVLITKHNLWRERASPNSGSDPNLGGGHRLRATSELAGPGTGPSDSRPLPGPLGQLSSSVNLSFERGTTLSPLNSSKSTEAEDLKKKLSRITSCPSVKKILSEAKHLPPTDLSISDDGPISAREKTPPQPTSPKAERFSHGTINRKLLSLSKSQTGGVIGLLDLENMDLSEPPMSPHKKASSIRVPRIFQKKRLPLEID